MSSPDISQVICITPSPDCRIRRSHFLEVEKYQEEESTRTAVRHDWAERIVEIARMLGGVKITEKAVDQAEEMLENAQKSTH